MTLWTHGVQDVICDSEMRLYWVIVEGACRYIIHDVQRTFDVQLVVSWATSAHLVWLELDFSCWITLEQESSLSNRNPILILVEFDTIKFEEFEEMMVQLDISKGIRRQVHPRSLSLMLWQTLLIMTLKVVDDHIEEHEGANSARNCLIEIISLS